MFKRIRGERGFTLVELLVVLAILAILIAIVVPNLAGITGGAKKTAAGTELSTVQSAMDTLMTETQAVTVSPGDNTTVGPSTAITCYKYDGNSITTPTTDYWLRLRTTSTGKYSWTNAGTVTQNSY